MDQNQVLAFPDKIKKITEFLWENKNFRKELERDMFQPVVSRTTDIFQLWKLNKSSFQSVAKLARHLYIPATQVNSERLFLTTGDIIDENQSQIIPFHAEQVCFIIESLILNKWVLF